MNSNKRVRARATGSCESTCMITNPPGIGQGSKNEGREREGERERDRMIVL
jgi:hypothetical protein